MKITVMFLIVLCSLNSLIYSQLQAGYPFRTFVDDAGNLYVTGNKNDNLFFKKYDESGTLLVDGEYAVTGGFAKGMDIIPQADDPTKIFVTGYRYSPDNSNGIDIILLKFDITANVVTLDWQVPVNNDNANMDDRALDLVMTDNGNLYVTGYVTQSDNSKDVVVISFNPANGVINWQDIYDELPGDEIGTHILADQGFIYVSGYMTQSDNQQLHDMMLLSYDDDGSNPEFDYQSYPESDDYSTSFIIAEDSPNSNTKSQVVQGGWSVSDPNTVFEQTDYLTLCYCVGATGTSLVPSWHKRFGTPYAVNIGTAIAGNDGGNVTVTGYFTSTLNASFDFGTIKYDGVDGHIVWDNIDAFGVLSGTDQATSIKRSGSHVIVAGYSQYSTNLFVTRYLVDYTTYVGQEWSNDYSPAYLTSAQPYQLHYAETYALPNGDVITFVSSSGEQCADYSAIKYDKNGEVLYTLDTEEDHFSQNHANGNEPGGFELKQNYPNPFNPVTKISYNLPFNSLVELKVFDILGKEIAVLVNNVQDAGSHTSTFDASGLPSGIYFYRLTSINGSNRFVKVDKMILAK